MALRARRAARRDLHGGAAVSRGPARPARAARAHRRARSDPGARGLAARDPGAPGLHRHRAAAVRRDPRPRRARAPARALRHRRRAQGPDPADPAAREGRRSLGIWINAAQHRVPLGARRSSRSPARGRSPRSSTSGPRRSTSSASPACSSRRSARSIPSEQARFTAGLVDLRQREGLYQRGRATA